MAILYHVIQPFHNKPWEVRMILPWLMGFQTLKFGLVYNKTIYTMDTYNINK